MSSFRNKHLDIINKIKKIDFNSEKTKKMLKFIEEKNIIEYKNKEKNLSEINSIYSPQEIISKFEKSLFNDMKNLLTHYKENIDKVNEILMHEKIIQNEYKEITKAIHDNEKEINEFIDFYSDYLKDNKEFLIRNEILKTFLDKILITKEEKDELNINEDNNNRNKNKNFSLITKMENLRDNIDVIHKNSSNFSKTLLMSVKEHYNTIDEMLHEKIVIYLKNFFRYNKRTFLENEFKEVLILLNYIKEKDKYLSFVLNEYTQMRKKVCEEILKEKYLSLNSKNFDEIFTSLNEDFIFYFMKEFILINFFFVYEIRDNSLILRSDILSLLNYPENENKDLNIEKIMETLSQTKNIDLTSLISNVNKILFIFEDLFFQQTQKKKLDFAEIYKITLLSYFYTEKIELIFKKNNLSNINLKLSLVIDNYKKNYSSIFKQLSNEKIRKLQKFKENISNYFSESQVLITNEGTINLELINLIEDYKKIFSLYEKYKIINDDKDIVNPNKHDLYIFLINFFSDNEIVKNEKSIDILFKIINLLNILNSSFENEKNKKCLNELIDRTVNLIIENVLSIVKFEDGLKENITHEQIINLVEHLMEKIQLNLMNINYIQEFMVKENIKEKIKKEILNIYNKVYENNINLGILTEEELKNYLDII